MIKLAPTGVFILDLYPSMAKLETSPLYFIVQYFLLTFILLTFLVFTSCHSPSIIILS